MNGMMNKRDPIIPLPPPTIEVLTALSIDTPYKIQDSKVVVLWYFFLIPENSRIFQGDADR